jgi:hypothetical protein
MKNFKLILMAGLLAGVFSQVSLAAGSDPNDTPVEGAQDVVEGSGCMVCSKQTVGGKLTDTPADKKDQHRDLLPDTSTGAPGKSEQGTQ